MKSQWKVWLFKGAGFGAGFALVLFACVAGWLWYSSRPKPWNQAAIKVSFLGRMPIDSSESVGFQYALENTTDKDYTISSAAEVRTGVVFVSNPAISLDSGPDLPKFDLPLFVPAKHTVRVTLHMPTFARLAACELVDGWQDVNVAPKTHSKHGIGKYSLADIVPDSGVKATKPFNPSDYGAVPVEQQTPNTGTTSNSGSGTGTQHGPGEKYGSNTDCEESLKAQFGGVSRYVLMDERTRFEIVFPMKEALDEAK